MDPKQGKTATGASHSPANKPNSHPKPTKSELMSSAKLVADAAKATLNHDPNNKKKVDKSELAGAAADLLNAASHYGKLEEKGVGKFVGKAETYLHKYETSHSTTTTTSSTTQHTQSSGGKHEQTEYIKMAEGLFKKYTGDTHSTQSAGGGDNGGHGTGGKKGDYIKMAGDFLKKH